MNRQRIALRQYIGVVDDVEVRIYVILRNVSLCRGIGDKLCGIFQPTVGIDRDFPHSDDADEQSYTVVAPA